MIMDETRTKTALRIGTKTVTIYPAGGMAPMVYCNDFEESGEEILEKCRELGTSKLHLVTVSGLRWDEEMSPWPQEPVVTKEDHFTGEAGAYLKVLLEQIIPAAEEAVKGRITGRVIAGYSMAGLFAVYAPFLTDRFDGAVCASGSVWYPGFERYFLEHAYAKDPDTIYFSLGGKESSAKHPALQKTKDVMEALNRECKKRGILSRFEMNPGNHFRDPQLRLAKGIAWTLRNRKGGDEE